MSQFDKLVKDVYTVILEQPNAPAPAAPIAPPPLPAAGAVAPSYDPDDVAMGGAQGAPASPTGDMDNAAKKDADPIAYVENMLNTLVDPKEGISPDMFDEFLNTFDIAAAKIEDKEGFAKFYREFYERLKYVMETKEEISDMFKTLHATVKDLLGSKEQTPDTAGGGSGKTGPSGPGVR